MKDWIPARPLAYLIIDSIACLGRIDSDLQGMWMNSQRCRYGAGGVTMIGMIVVLTLSGCGRGQPRPMDSQLPALVAYERLPAGFNQRLQDAFEEVRRQPHEPEPVRRLARLYHANGLFAEARSCYRVVIAGSNGATARDHYHLADIAQTVGNLAEAETELRASLALDPSYLPARLALANTAFKAGDEAAAERAFSEVLKQAPDQPQASLGLARIELQKGQDDAALARLEELMAAHPGSTAAAALFAQVLERLGQTDRAVAVSQMSLQKPEPPLADPWLAELLEDCYDPQRLSIAFEEYFKLGQLNAALPLLDRLSAIDPGSSTTKIFRGFADARAGRHAAAEKEFREALVRGGDPERICPYLAQSLLDQGKLTEADRLLADYSARLPDSIPIAKFYADVASRKGDDRLARTLLTKVLASEPNLYAQNMSLAKILWTSGEKDLATKYLQTVATVYASDVPSRALLGEYFLGKNDPSSATRYLEEAHTHVAANTPAQAGLAALLGTAYLQLADGEIESGRLAEAAELYDKAIRFAPGEVAAHAGKANACVQLKQFAPAAAALERLTALLPDNPTVYLSLGDVLYQGGQKDQASRRWQKALQLTASDDRELRAVLAERLAGRITEETFR